MTTPASDGHVSLIDQNDFNDWVDRFNLAFTDSSTVTEPAAPDAHPWAESFFGCFMPVDTCLVTCCMPCITFGKTHHRVHKDRNMKSYYCVNASCLMFTGFSCLGLHFIPTFFQRVDIRRRYNLHGDCLSDLFTSCCCVCCSIIQQDKEAEVREKELATRVDAKGYAEPQGMAYMLQR
ncbi:PLAC8 family-domain-containing protein [Exophiala viscosa]|uniref:PLAC8 family-domain-containing protein n=1 Tax=Exophiala viscosa TaxID=2486360 RepID=UPI002196AEF6|nr:PLAC8 family-domain-containing protein [Exophiala viscosa]